MAKRPQREGGLFGSVSALPFLVLVFGLAGYAAVQVVEMAFSKVRITGGRFLWSFAGLDNFRHVLANPTAMRAVVNTVVFVAATVTLTVLLGTILALLVRRSRLLQATARSVIIWPTVVAPVVVSVIWLLVLSPNVGLLNRVLTTLALPTQQWLGFELGAMAAIIIVDVWHWTPIAFLLLYTALVAMDAEILEAAQCDGASDWQVVRFIELPMLVPAIAVTGFIRAVMSVKAFDEMYLLTAGGPNDATTLVSLHIRDVFFDQLDYGYGAAFSVLVVAMVGGAIGLLLLGRRVAGRWGGAPA